MTEREADERTTGWNHMRCVTAWKGQLDGPISTELGESAESSELLEIDAELMPKPCGNAWACGRIVPS